MKKNYFFTILLFLLLSNFGFAQNINFTISPPYSDGSEDVYLDITTESDSRTIIQAEIYAWYEDEDGITYGQDEFYSGSGTTNLTLGFHWNLWYDNVDIHAIALHYEYYILYSDNTISTERFSYQISQ